MQNGTHLCVALFDRVGSHARKSLFELHAGTLRSVPPETAVDPLSTVIKGLDSLSLTFCIATEREKDREKN